MQSLDVVYLIKIYCAWKDMLLYSYMVGGGGGGGNKSFILPQTYNFFEYQFE